MPDVGAVAQVRARPLHGRLDAVRQAEAAQRMNLRTSTVSFFTPARGSTLPQRTGPCPCCCRRRCGSACRRLSKQRKRSVSTWAIGPASDSNAQGSLQAVHGVGCQTYVNLEQHKSRTSINEAQNWAGRTLTWAAGAARTARRSCCSTACRTHRACRHRPECSDHWPDCRTCWTKDAAQSALREDSR